tara:strand:+ start:98 stop:607 length:510 start_codon:yes stop_codon:yes gene_type:complete
MKKILIISATGNTNYSLSEDLASYINNNMFDVKIINLETYNIPLFIASRYEEDKKKYYSEIIKLTNLLLDADGLIICAPEYNGNVPPIVSNAISWISVSTDYWKDAFKNKNCFIASSSGGPAEKFQISMENQLIHLGCIVFNKKIIVNSKNRNNTELSKKHINDFVKLL